MFGVSFWLDRTTLLYFLGIEGRHFDNIVNLGTKIAPGSQCWERKQQTMSSEVGGGGGL